MIPISKHKLVEPGPQGEKKVQDVFAASTSGVIEWVNPLVVESETPDQLMCADGISAPEALGTPKDPVDINATEITIAKFLKNFTQILYLRIDICPTIGKPLFIN